MPSESAKPVVFLSHTATDEPIVRVIHDEISRVFANGVEVFATSVPGVVQPGEKWLENINDKLGRAKAVIVLITPVSINRPWIWFEVGASWSRMDAGDGKIIPVCVPEIEKKDLPEPLSRLQAMSLGKASETRLVFESLIDLFGFGSMKGFKHATIKAKLPKYADLTVSDEDLNSGAVYTGPYEGYSDEELEEVLDDKFLEDAWNNLEGFDHGPFQENKLLHFRQIDEQYALPPGAARRLLIQAATKRYPLKVTETPNTVRFKVDHDLWHELRTGNVEEDDSA